MFASLTSTALDQVEVVRQMAVHHEKLVEEQESSKRLQLRLYSMSSSVTRLYAIYERFVESLVADYLDLIPEISSYADLPCAMRNEYRIGISHLLSRIDRERYRHLTHENLIRWYHEALTGHVPYRFIPEALTRHDNNLRLTTLTGMFERAWLPDLHGWLSHHQSILDLFPDSTSIWEQLEAELKNFIQLRNDAAHGAPTTLLGEDALSRACDLVGALVEALSSFVHHQAVLRCKAAGKCVAIGEVTEVFDRPGAFILALRARASIAVGGSIHLVGQWSCVETRVDSLQLNDVPIEGIGALVAGTEVGVGTAVIPRRNVTAYVDAGPAARTE
jgi:MAE_28990/MAE_18760-like HEPN